MLREQDHAVIERDDARVPPSEPPLPIETEESNAVLRRIERLLFEIRGRIETTDRAQRHQHFSLARLLGALLQVLAVCFVIAAVADWVYGSSPGSQLVLAGLRGACCNWEHLPHSCWRVEDRPA